MRAAIKDILKGGADVYELEEEVARLRRELADANARCAQFGEELQRVSSELSGLSQAVRSSRAEQSGASYDLVRLDNVSLFVPTRDNLYEGFIPHACKGFSLEQHYALAKTEAAPAPSDLETDVTKVMLAYIDVLFHGGHQVHLLDLGAWVGDFALRLGKFAQQRGAPLSADCYDPSLAGSLIPFNIELNDLGTYVLYKPIGLSVCGGPQIFFQLRGHSDASRLSSTKADLPWLTGDSYPIRTITLAEALPTSTSHLMVKLDVEGLDAQIILQNAICLTNATLIFEFSPGQSQYAEIEPAEFLGGLLHTHSLFDLYYLPRPTRSAPIDAETMAAFIEQVRHRPYGYTDILAVPRTLSEHDAITGLLGRLRPTAPSYMMA